MAVAMLASIVAMSCGLGAVAAFRVNHDSLTRLPAAGPPLQLALNATPAAVTDGTPAPFGVRFAVLAPQTAGAAADLAAVKLARGGNPESPPSVIAAAPETGSASIPAPTSAAATAIADTSSPDETNRNATREAKTDTAALAATEPTTDDSLPAEPAGPHPEATSDVAIPDMTKLDAASPESAQPESKPPAAAARTAATTTHKASRRRRLAATIHRPRKAQAIASVQTTDQNSGSLAPNFQFGSSASPPQPAKSRRVERTAAKATAATSAVGGPFVRPETQ
jgi:hypothetical protein